MTNPADQLKHDFIDMTAQGIGPQRICSKCGAREGSKFAISGICSPDRLQAPKGVKSEYDPTNV